MSGCVRFVVRKDKYSIPNSDLLHEVLHEHITSQHRQPLISIKDNIKDLLTLVRSLVTIKNGITPSTSLTDIEHHWFKDITQDL